MREYDMPGIVSHHGPRYFDIAECVKCDGEGYILEECAQCNWTAEHYPGETCECCNGNGLESDPTVCSDCYGEGFITNA